MKKRLVIVSAPSGTGKTSLDLYVQRHHADRVTIVRSCTTRPARSEGTVEKSYLHVTPQEFQQMRTAGEFIEWAEVFGNLYGTTEHEVTRITAAGKTALLEIDVQGGQQIKTKFPDSLAVFILPPSIAELHRRLTQRGTDTAAAQQKRLQAACVEIQRGRTYDCFMVNADFATSCTELENIVLQRHAPRLTRTQGIACCDRLVEEFQQYDWQRTAEVG